MYCNHVMLIGNLTRDPEMKALPNGGSVTSFSIATNHSWKDKNGQKQESTEYHNIVTFGKTAESCAQYLKKGQSAMVEGRIQTRTWEKDGQKQYRTEIVADSVQFGPKKDGQTAPQEDIAIQYPDDEVNASDVPY
jgi:single-strand DNA-binding protein